MAVKTSTRAPARKPWSISRGEGPVVATAIHGGHDMRPEVARYVALGDAERRREEDLYTDWTDAGDSQVVVRRSRFEVDLNRPRDKAVYLSPEDCWGLELWSEPLPEEIVEDSRRLHDQFYEELHALIDYTWQRWGKVLILDLHSYNHRRTGSGQPPADQRSHPDINVGTRWVDRRKWGPLIDTLQQSLRSHQVKGAKLDVAENIKFEGAYLVQWANATFTDVCALALEVKKIYMDEVAGKLDYEACEQVSAALKSAASACRRELAP